MEHSHTDARPTIGCDACIQIVREDRFATRLASLDDEDLLDVALAVAPEIWAWPLVDAEMGRRFGPNCMADDCASYDPSRDASVYFVSEAEHFDQEGRS